jgi:predicted nucleic acid-binding protein
MLNYTTVNMPRSFCTSAKADYLVTGDSDLLEIKKYKDIKIITPRDFEAMFA